MIVDVIIGLISLYLVCGFVFAIAFVSIGIIRVDETAKGSPIGFRIIIIPGVIVFWVFLLRKWLQANKKNRHE